MRVLRRKVHRQLRRRVERQQNELRASLGRPFVEFRCLAHDDPNDLSRSLTTRNIFYRTIGEVEYATAGGSTGTTTSFNAPSAP